MLSAVPTPLIGKHQEIMARNELILTRALLSRETAIKLREAIRLNRFIFRHELKYTQYLVQATRRTVKDSPAGHLPLPPETTSRP